MLILAPLILAALVYGVIMWLRYSLAVPACVVEDLPAGKAIKRSVELSSGSRGRIFVLWLLVALVRMLLGMLEPTRGSGKILDQDIGRLSNEMRAKIGYIAEGRGNCIYAAFFSNRRW